MSTWVELRDNPRLADIYAKRCQIIRLIREFFWSIGFTETDTPLALRFPGQEPYLNPVPVTLHDPVGKAEQFYLHTSPEFALKKLLATGFGKIFSITKCFRDYEAFGDGTHNTEFTMIEWYRAPGTYFDFMDDTERLFKYIGEKMGIYTLKYNGHEVSLSCHSERSEESLNVCCQNKPKDIKQTLRDSSARANSVGMTAAGDRWDRKTMKQVWQEYVSVNLDERLSLASMRELAKDKRYEISDDDAYEDIFFKIFLNEIEPHLGLERPVFVSEYPQQLCSLSRACPTDPRYAERAELYIAGLEIANGFGELTDAREQASRLELDRELRGKLGRETWPVDPEFIAALRSGIPASAGIALGVDRMVLLFTGANAINEVIFQTVQDQLT